jgi:ADP-heptose:LPS heptosyltransferase
MYLMVLLRNLLHRGDTLTLVGGIIYPLRDWFPYAHFVPDPAIGEMPNALAGYDRLIQMFPRTIAGELATDHFDANRLLQLINLPGFRQRSHILDAMQAIAEQEFGLAVGPHGTPFAHNGIRPPPHLQRQRYANRVVIHPVASNAFKTWPLQKFVALARWLKAHGLAPCFVVPPADAQGWRISAPDIEIAAFDDLADVAALLYESGWFVGNDSGIGHLASALGLPTLSLFPRAGLARRWRPGWGNNIVALPLPVMPITKLKERFWKPLLPLSRVVTAFESLREREQAQKRYESHT